MALSIPITHRPILVHGSKCDFSVSTLIGGGDTRALTAVIEFEFGLFALSGDAKTLLLHPCSVTNHLVKLLLPNILHYFTCQTI